MPGYFGGLRYRNGMPSLGAQAEKYDLLSLVICATYNIGVASEQDLIIAAVFRFTVAFWFPCEGKMKDAHS